MFTLYNKVLFMSGQNQHLDSINDIRQLMHRSSRFISLSGLSGIAAGVCALVAAWFAGREISAYGYTSGGGEEYGHRISKASLEYRLIGIAVITFVLAFLLAFFFTWLRSRKTGVPLWGFVARKLMINVAVPMLAGGLLIWRMIEGGVYVFVAPACLLFYGLALINASKFTFTDIRYLGYAQLVLGAINLWVLGYGLYFWAIGFGLLHIIYGFIMWWKNERYPEQEQAG